MKMVRKMCEIDRWMVQLNNGSISKKLEITYPYLKFDSFVLTEDGLHFEINTDSGDESGCKWVVGVTEEEGCLAHAAVTDDQQFKHVIEILIGRIFLPPIVLAHRHLRSIPT